MSYSQQQIAKALGYTRVRITDAPRVGANLIMTIWKVPRRDGRTGKGIDRDTVNKLPNFTPEEIAKAEEILKKMLCKGETDYVNKGIHTAVPCSNKAWRDGYCKTHHPGEAKAIEAKKTERWKKRYEEEENRQAIYVASAGMARARKVAGLLTLKEARALGAKV